MGHNCAVGHPFGLQGDVRSLSGAGVLRQREGRGERPSLQAYEKCAPYGIGGLPERTCLVDALFDAKGSNVELATVAVFEM